ncbi:glycosyl transferase family 2 [Novosphingobium sp. PC22D]|uniref:glycosyltransferase family 2 protein n=1 Tax=Novosphingobium sp. PC22D TaxID=1962403 RepID=UPI000BF0F6A5|nr:glycosyltransferase family A protein [Novosphingobium sp. PC22D]PEQ10500.1 glycosyl transferase family 2 [Novosphingobium sp. PC22D]
MTNPCPHFSVIVPVYNAAETIDATIDSVLAQTDADFELILVDDGSTDDSLSRMLSRAEQHEQIRLVSRRNSGVSATRNFGVEMARGTLLAFLDADDLWHPEKLASHRAAHDADPDLSISFARIAFLETGAPGDAQPRTTSTVPAGLLTVGQVIGENPVCTTSNLVVTRDAFARIGDFVRGMNHAEDQEWLARAISRGESVRGLQQLLVAYRMSPTGLSTDFEAMYAGWRELAQRFGSQHNLHAAEAHYCRYLARRALRSGGAANTALRFAMRGLALDRAAFLDDFRRGGATLVASLVALLIPGTLRTRLFA